MVLWKRPSTTQRFLFPVHKTMFSASWKTFGSFHLSTAPTSLSGARREEKHVFFPQTSLKCQRLKRMCILLGGFSISVNPLPHPDRTPPVGRRWSGLEKSPARNATTPRTSCWFLHHHQLSISRQALPLPTCSVCLLRLPSSSEELSWSLALHKCVWPVRSSLSLVFFRLS